MTQRTRGVGFLLLALLTGCAGPTATVERVSRPGEYAGYSDPVYDGYQRTSQYLTMRDGVRLAIDIYRPTRDGALHEEPLPVVWTHHRYNRAYFHGDSIVDYIHGFGRGTPTMLAHGYVIAAVDTRGGGASFGTQQGFFMPEEAKDAYEITEWLAAQPWSSGKIGMLGRSYLGITQLFAASQAPPSLKAIFPEMVVFEWYPMIYPGGVYRDDFFAAWQSLTHKLDRAIPFKMGEIDFGGVAPVDGPSGMILRDSAIAGHRINRDMFEMWRGVPYRNSIDPVSGKMIHQERGPATYLDAINASGVAVYDLVGWMDAFPRDALLWFANLEVPQKLIIGPWFHGQGEGFDLGVERTRWFDYWLKGIDNGIMNEPPIRYFVLDAPDSLAWRTADTWPIPAATPTPYYFGGGEPETGERPIAGLLSTAEPTVPEASDRRVIDTTATLGTGTRWTNTYGGAIGYPDLAPNDAKGWSYTTEPLATDVEVIGHPIVNLWVESSANDVDAFVYLEDLEPSGRSTYVTEGVLRASHRTLARPDYQNFGLPWPRSHESDVAALPSQPTELVFDLLPTAKRFRAGHRIRITVQGSDRDTHRKVFPDPPPLVTIHRDGAHPSHVVLPIAPLPEATP